MIGVNYAAFGRISKVELTTFAHIPGRVSNAAMRKAATECSSEIAGNGADWNDVTRPDSYTSKSVLVNTS